MARRFFRKTGWILNTAAAVLALAMVIFCLRVLYTDKSEADFKLAKGCPTSDNCRKRISATISKSISIHIRLRGGKTLPAKSDMYKLSIFSSELGSRSFKIIPDKPLLYSGFDIEDVFIPSTANPDFVQENFLVGEIVYVEIWRDRIVFLFVDSIIDIPSNVTTNNQNSDTSQNQTILTAAPPKTYNIAIPTSDHPTLRAENAKNDLILLSIPFGMVLLIYTAKAFKLLTGSSSKNKEVET